MQIYFKAYYQDDRFNDFCELEIAAGGIIRGFMSLPYDMYYAIQRKVRCCLETAFLANKVPEKRFGKPSASYHRSILKLLFRRR